MARILVCDDDEIMQSIIEAALSRDGHEVVCVDNGRALQAKLRASEYDLLICDIVMPDADGLEIIRALRRSGNLTKIIVISAGTGGLQSPLLNAAVAFGANDVIAKPFGAAQLRAAVARLRAEAPT